jgi:hypothetical protein
VKFLAAKNRQADGKSFLTATPDGLGSAGQGWFLSSMPSGNYTVNKPTSPDV